MSSNISRNSYWQKAYDSLSANLQANFQHSQTCKRDVLEAVLKTAEEKREICIRKRWIQNFVAVGDVAVQYNTSSAALPWAAVRFLLLATINDTQVDGAVVSDLETVSRLIARYKEFEHIHLQRNLTMEPQMEECLVRLYADILSFLSMAVGYFGSSTLVRTTKNAFKAPSISYSQTILQQEAELLKVAGLSDSEKLYYLEESFIRLIDRTTAYDKGVDEAKHVKLVRWLSTVPVSAHHTLRSDERMSDSAKWLLDHEDYRSWKNSSSSAMLLLHGIAGSGKSILCSAGIDSYLKNQTANTRAAPLAFFYCADFKFEPERSQPSEIFRSIVKQLTVNQLAQQSPLAVRDVILSEFERRDAQSRVDGLELQKLSIQDCVKLIQEVTAVDPVTIVIDALDEIERYSRPQLVDGLKQIVSNSLNVVKVFLTCRNDSRVFTLSEEDVDTSGQPSGRLQKICISRDDTLEDMEAYVKCQLSVMKSARHLLNGNVSWKLCEVLVDKLVTGAEEDIMEILNNGNFVTLDDIYDAVLHRILTKGRAARDIAIYAFSWLLYMQEAMPSQSLLKMISKRVLPAGSNIPASDLIESCSNLVLLDGKQNTFRFSHHADEASFRLATSCLQAETVLFNAPYRYAAIYWPHYSSQVHKEKRQDLLFTDMLSFIYDSPDDISLSFITWMDQVKQITAKLSNDHPLKAAQGAIPNNDYSPLYVASIFGLERLLKAIAAATDSKIWDQRNDVGHTSLYLACAFGHASVASTLIGYGANMNIQCGRFGSYLQAACYSGHTAVVSLLLAHGASIHQSGAFKNALQAAFKGQQENAALLVLQQDSAIRNDADYMEATESAAQYGFLRVIEQLETSPLAPAYIKSVDKIRAKTAKAIKGGQHGVLATFLKSSPNAIAILPPESVALAAIHGHNDITRLLVDLGVGIEHECSLGSPLRCASLMNRESTVRLLITLGANVNGLCSHGTALQAASLSGHMRIVKLLLDEGVDVTHEGGVYGTALQAAAYHGHHEIVDLLLKAAASAHVQRLAKDASCAAWILDQGLLDDKGGEYYRFVGSGPQAMMGLVSKTVDTLYHQPETTYRDVLAAADKAGVWSTSKCSVGEHAQTIHSQTSAEVGNVRALSAILDRREPLDIHFTDIIQALKVAAFNGHIAVIHLLVERVPKLLSVANGYALLEQAIPNYHLDVINLVIEHMDPGGWNVQGLQALLTQACRANVAVAEAVVSLARRSVSVEVVSEMVETAFVQVLKPVDKRNPRESRVIEHGPLTTVQGDVKESNDENHADMIDWLYKQIGSVKHIHSQEVFTLACNRSLQSTAARIIQNTGKNCIGKNNILNGITLSASNGCIDLLEYLVDCLSTDDKRLAVVDWLLRRASQGETFNTDIIQGLILASSHGHSRVVNALLEAGADVNTAAAVNADDLSGGPNRSRPILPTQHPDTMSSQFHIVTALQAALDRITSLNTTWKLADKGCIGNYERTIKALIDHGADVNLRNGYSQSPLQIAARCGSRRLVRWFVDAGAKVTAMVDGRDALIAAAEREESSFEVVQTLLDSGAQVPSEATYIDRFIIASLRCFVIKPQPFFDSSEGQFALTNSLGDVFSKGPGAVLRLLLEKTNWQRLYSQYPLVLQMTCVLGDRSYVDLLLKRGVNINTVCSYYGTALQAAARHGHILLVQQLLEAGADPKITGGKHATALRAAVKGGHSEVVHALLSFGANTKVPGKTTKYSLLNIAAELGNAYITSILLHVSAEAFSTEDQQRSLILACASGSLDTVRYLLGAGINPNIVAMRESWPINQSSREMAWMAGSIGHASRQMSPLHMCCYHGNEEMIRLLLDEVPELELEIQDSKTPLIIAAERGYAGIIHLVAAGADTTHRSDFGTPLSVAIEGEHLDAVRILLAAGAPVYDQTRGINEVLCGFRSESLPVLELLVEAAVSVPDGEPAILEAIRGWRNWVSTDLVQHWSETRHSLLHQYFGPSTEGLLAAYVRTKTGFGALHLAAQHLHPDVVQALLEHGANPNNQSPQIGSVLNAAMLGCVEKGLPKKAKPRDANWSNDVAFGWTWGTDRETRCERTVKILVEHGVKVTDTSFRFGTSLHLACFIGNESIITMLVSKGSDVNSNAGYFRNPLFAAIHRYHRKAVEVLLNNGANPSSYHPKFGPALSYAREKGLAYLRIPELLLHHGADP
ncbi:ankyrin repeat-containing domain protein [Xylaria longipes]|nr:ankyrin repeat-containing domain protein [Xylaria longipes]